jgi:hypothetical protein
LPSSSAQSNARARTYGSCQSVATQFQLPEQVRHTRRPHATTAYAISAHTTISHATTATSAKRYFCEPQSCSSRITCKPLARTAALSSLNLLTLPLQGVGETVRGTLNNEIDTRFPRSNSQKAAAANAKNQSVLESGYREMAPLAARRSQYRHGSQDMQQAPPLPSPAASEPVPPHFIPSPLQPHQQQQLATPPPPPPSEFGSYGGNPSSDQMSQVPSSFSPESSGSEQKRIGLRKLMKRRPVPGSYTGPPLR